MRPVRPVLLIGSTHAADIADVFRYRRDFAITDDEDVDLYCAILTSRHGMRVIGINVGVWSIEHHPLAFTQYWQYALIEAVKSAAARKKKTCIPRHIYTRVKYLERKAAA